MTTELYLNSTTLHFAHGFPSVFMAYALPHAQLRHATGPWGTVCIQEVWCENVLLRHFIFAVNRMLNFDTNERNEGLQTLVVIRGEMEYMLKGLPVISLKERDFHMLNAHEVHGIISLKGDKTCSVLSVYYAPAAYENLLPYFPEFKNQLKKSFKRAFTFSKRPWHARFTVNDAIQAIWFDKYAAAAIEKKYVEMKLQTTLFTLLAETYSLSVQDTTTAFERAKAAAAREIILQNIKKHLTPEEIALQLYCSPSWLKKAFSKVYGIGLFHFLRRTRMERAKEMLLRGASLKYVALEVGMKPSNFPKEFKAFFGYTVTELKKGLS